MVKIVDLNDKWAVLIGRLFIAFGSIERTTHNCLIDWLKDPTYAHISKMRFSQRVDVIIDLLGTLEFVEQNKADLIQGLKKAKKLAEKRNIVAHNPLMLDLFDGDFKEIIISNTKDGVTITFEELQQITQSAESLSTELINTCTKIKLEGWEGLPITSQLRRDC